MQERRQHIRALIETLGKRKTGFRYPDKVKRRILAFVDAELEDGAKLSEVASFLGIGYDTLKRWIDVRAGGTFASVSVKSAPAVEKSAVLSMVAPSGWRMEGLDVSQVIELARSLQC